MKIRSITTFLNPGWPIDETRMHQAGKFNQAARLSFEQSGYEVQTTRLATLPFPLLIQNGELAEVLSFAQTLENAATAQGYEYTSIGPALPEAPWSYLVIPEILAATENLFTAGVISSEKEGISLSGIRGAAQIIHKCAALDPNGFGNLYFAALANVQPFAPFFPAAYHDGGPPKFALATEAAGLAVSAFTDAGTLAEAQENLIFAMQKHSQSLLSTAQELSDRFGVAFAGIDFTLAPFPNEMLSLGTALEKLGVPMIGYHGTLAAAAFLTSAMDQVEFPRTGFCGLFLPLLEDSTLALRGSQGSLTVNDLLMYSAVCGTGLDTIPLPGDTSEDHLTALLLDLAALADRLKKPLTARLMPVPGKKAGERTSFDFPFFANSKVMELKAGILSGPLAGSETIQLVKRSR